MELIRRLLRATAFLFNLPEEVAEIKTLAREAAEGRDGTKVHVPMRPGSDGLTPEDLRRVRALLNDESRRPMSPDDFLDE